MSLSLLGSAHGDFRLPLPRMRRAEISVELQRLVQFTDRSRRAIGLDLDEPQPEMRPIVAWRNRDALDQERLGGGQPLGPMLGGVDGPDQHIGSRRADKGVYVGRIERHGAFETFTSAFDVIG